MTRLFPAVLALASLAALAPAAAQGQEQGAAACPAVLRHTLPRLQDEKPQNLCQYAGRVLLVVNTASHCGFTSQYRGLEALHRRYKDRGLVVLGFPSNDFAQEKGSNREIAEFCENTFGVQFPMFAASSVRGAQANPVHRELARQSGRQPLWNFHKYLVGRNGQVAAHYAAFTGPEDAALVQRIEQLLAQP